MQAGVHVNWRGIERMAGWPISNRETPPPWLPAFVHVVPEGHSQSETARLRFHQVPPVRYLQNVDCDADCSQHPKCGWLRCSRFVRGDCVCATPDLKCLFCLHVSWDFFLLLTNRRSCTLCPHEGSRVQMRDSQGAASHHEILESKGRLEMHVKRSGRDASRVWPKTCAILWGFQRMADWPISNP